MKRQNKLIALWIFLGSFIQTGTANAQMAQQPPPAGYFCSCSCSMDGENAMCQRMHFEKVSANDGASFCSTGPYNPNHGWIDKPCYLYKMVCDDRRALIPSAVGYDCAQLQGQGCSGYGGTIGGNVFEIPGGKLMNCAPLNIPQAPTPVPTTPAPSESDTAG